jgi:hypothetical protein
VKISEFSDDQLKQELKRRKEKKDAEAYKKHLAKPYRPGKQEVIGKKMVRCFPECRDKDLWITPYGATCMVCGDNCT